MFAFSGADIIRSRNVSRVSWHSVDSASSEGIEVKDDDVLLRPDVHEKGPSQEKVPESRVALIIFREPDDPFTATDVDDGAADDAGGERRSYLGSMIASTANWLSKRFQPEPKMLHCELALINLDCEVVHHATYIGQCASWQVRDREYYGKHGWRALVVPASRPEQVDAIGNACSQCSGAPYSLTRYLASTSIGSFFARWLPDNPDSPAHCGGLAARILYMALGESIIDKPPPRYSPSLLYTRLCEVSGKGMLSRSASNAPSGGGGLPAPEAACALPDQTQQRLLDLLRSGSDEAIDRVSHSECAQSFWNFANETLHSYQRMDDVIIGDEGGRDRNTLSTNVERQREVYRLAMRLSASCERRSGERGERGGSSVDEATCNAVVLEKAESAQMTNH